MDEFPYGKTVCPKCMDEIPVVKTAYGFRAVCGDCNIRWTRLRGETDWVNETNSPMRDNLGGTDGDA